MLGPEYVYEKATSAAMAFEIINELASDGIRVILIISDWLMPGMKGDEFLEKVKEIHPEIRAIMITGHIDEAATQRVLNNDSVLTVLHKPWDPDELKDIVVSACGTSGENC
jgi:response regulator RpfG family c-di-GMP phosphodiesterase